MSAKERRKGAELEREIVNLHQEIGICAERYPLSGASRFRGKGHDVDVYVFGKDEAALTGEVKGRKGADGFRLLGRWLGDNDLLFLRRNRANPLVVLPWRIWERLLRELNAWPPEHRKLLRDAISGGRAGRADAGGSDGNSETQTEDRTHPARQAAAAITGGEHGRVVCGRGAAARDESGADAARRPARAPTPPISALTDGDAPRKARRMADRKTRA